MNTNQRRVAWIAAFAAVAVLLWFAWFRHADAPRAVPGAAQSSMQAPTSASPPVAPLRKAVVPKIARQTPAPDLPAHELPAWDAPFGESIAELRKWSDAGDANAQVELTERLKLCTSHDLKEAELIDSVDRARMERTAQDSRLSDEQRAERHASTQSRIDRHAEIRDVCVKLPKDLLDHWLDPADRAAQSGNVSAMLTYAKSAFADYEDVASVAADIDEVIERRDKARAYLEEAARRGDQHTLVMFAEMHSDASVVRTKLPIYAPDPALAYAYAFAASRASDVTPVDRETLGWLMPYSAAALDTQALANAQAEGERLYQQCCAGH